MLFAQPGKMTSLHSKQFPLFLLCAVNMSASRCGFTRRRWIGIRKQGDVEGDLPTRTYCTACGEEVLYHHRTDQLAHVWAWRVEVHVGDVIV